MSAEERRAQIERLLAEASEPVNAASLADLLGVTRQVIVSDVALLRAKGVRVAATPRGYLLNPEQPAGIPIQIVCRHSPDETAEELYTIVDNGGAVTGVAVEHSLYGRISAEMHLYCRRDVQEFMERSQAEDVHLLSDLTDGLHLHTVVCPSQQACKYVLDALRRKGFLLEPEKDGHG